jgi:hypothetical protein
VKKWLIMNRLAIPLSFLANPSLHEMLLSPPGMELENESDFN